MTQNLQYLVLIGAVVQIIGTFSYVKETIKGNTKPNRVSWLLWSIAPIIGTFAAISDGVGWAVLPVFMAGFGPFLVFLSSFVNKKSYWKLEKFDYLCGVFSVLALILWALTKQPLVAIIFAIISDAFAAIPTLIKSWKSPETETAHIYMSGLFSALTSFAAIKMFSISELAFPIYFVILDSSLILLTARKRLD